MRALVLVGVHPCVMLTPGLLGVPWLIWSGLCLVVAAIYSYVWPRPMRTTSVPGFRQLILRWSHAAVWLGLAASCLIRAGSGPVVLADVFAQAALVLYLVFLGTLVIDRAQRH